MSVRFGRGRTGRTVLNGSSIRVRPGQRGGLAGPSGSGKSTLARVLALMQAPHSGAVSIDGSAVSGFGLNAPIALSRAVAMLWQSPRLATDPRFTLREVIAEPLILGRLRPERTERDSAVAAQVERVGLTADLLPRRPFEVSEGQLQRACLARALVAEPRYLLCDEPTSMLGVSTQAFLLQVIDDRRRSSETGVLLVSHDRVLLSHWCDRVLDISDLRNDGAMVTTGA